MRPQSASPGGMMARAIDEALASVTTPERARDALDAALAHAGLDAVPERPSETAAFVCGALCLVLERIFGEDTAEVVIESLRPVVEVASGYHPVPDGSEAPPPSGEAAAPPHGTVDRGTVDHGTVDSAPGPAPAAPAPVGPPVVLVATLDRAGVVSVAAGLEGVAEVRPVADAFEWLAGLDAFTGRRLIAVLDCCLPAFDPLWAAQMAGSMPPHTEVVVWGATDDVREGIRRATAGSPNWHELGQDADASRLARYLASGL